MTQKLIEFVEATLTVDPYRDKLLENIQSLIGARRNTECHGKGTLRYRAISFVRHTRLSYELYRLKQIIGIVLFLIMLSPFAYGETVKEGEPPPTFVLMDDRGKLEDIERLMDRPTIMYFTHNACHYCTQVIAMLKRAEAEFGSEKLRIIGINVMAKDRKLVQAYKEALEFTFPMFAGNRGDVLRAYKINYVPVLVFVDANKTVRKVVGHYIHEPELHKIIREIIGE